MIDPRLDELATLRFLSMYRDAEAERALSQLGNRNPNEVDLALARQLPSELVGAAVPPINPYADLMGTRELRIYRYSPWTRLLFGVGGAGTSLLGLTWLQYKLAQRAMLSRQLSWLRLARLLGLLKLPISGLLGYLAAKELT